jgi:hypothetical protein
MAETPSSARIALFISSPKQPTFSPTGLGLLARTQMKPCAKPTQRGAAVGLDPQSRCSSESTPRVGKWSLLMHAISSGDVRDESYTVLHRRFCLRAKKCISHMRVMRPISSVFTCPGSACHARTRSKPSVEFGCALIGRSRLSFASADALHALPLRGQLVRSTSRDLQ